MEIQESYIDYSKNWCYVQWQSFGQSEHLLKKIARVITLPMLLIATLFAEIGSRIYRLFVKELSLDEQYAKLVQLQQNLDPNLFWEAQKHESRNRYRDVLPNDPTRFKIEGEPSFYFNANWVLNGHAIACQGPMGHEIEEFWKMVDHGNIQTIVMLTNPIEGLRDKCSEYWKTRPFTEEKVFENESELIVRRKIDLNGKTITQYHLQNWPDHGTVSSKTLAELVKLTKNEEGKILAHCSAGIGRTGTFFAAFEAYRQGTSTIFPIAADLRDPQKGRVGMIQTLQQYHLAHQTARQLML